jgi:hypothetical protein
MVQPSEKKTSNRREVAMLSRRAFLLGASASLVLAGRSLHAAERPKRVAFLGTEVRRHSHAQHFLDRMTLGYAWGGRWQDPRVEVASVYIDQFPEGDLARERIACHRLRQFPTIEEALTLGGEKLAVDGVVIIAEHGDYPTNEKGQKLYPRYRWFKQVVDVFKSSGRAVPVFNDKHLSTDWTQCAEMVADSQQLDFAFLAGSSLPVTWRLPAVDLPHGAELAESVCVAYGGVDSYDFHALETAQCMSERRRGGEVGIRSVHAARGERLWAILDADERRVTRELFAAGLRRSNSLPVDGGYPADRVNYEWARRALPDTLGYLIEHHDGLRTSIFLTSIQDFNYAGLISTSGEIVSCQMHLPMPGRSATTADFFNPLVRHIEQTMLTGRAAYPPERTLLTSGMVIGGVESLHRGQVPVQTPEMEVRYQVGEESLFWRE